MKILYDDQIFATQRFGGISRYITEIAGRASAQADVLVSAGMHLNQYLQHNPALKRSGFFADVDKAWRVRDSFNQVWTGAASHAFQPDVVHETYYRVRHLHPRKAKVVVTVHDMIHELYPTEAPHAAYHAAMKKAAVTRADAIICVSHTTKNDLLSIYPELRSKHILTIPHGHSFQQPTQLGLKTIRSFVNESPYILFVGHRSGYKRFEDLLIATKPLFKKINGLKILCFGCGEFSTDEKLTLQKHDIQAKDVLYTSGSDDILNAAYSMAQVFVYPSIYEGFGIPILEALAAGIQVICADTKIFREVGGENVIYFPPTDHIALSEKIEGAISNANTKEKLIPHTASWEQSYLAHQSLYTLLSSH